MRLELQSPAKINLLLNILGRRADGFHALETVLQPVPLFDLLSFESGASGLELTCSDPRLATDDSNLVRRAAQAFAQATGLALNLRIHLEKRIPLAAGLGGGSSNAAATLRGLNELWGRPLAAARLCELAAGLGSDVPFFLQDQPALATGRGETIEPLPPFPALAGAWVLLIHPGFGISTAWAYANLARFPTALNGTPGRARRLLERLREGSLAAAAPEFYNSLEAPAFAKYPILELYQEFLRAGGVQAALMSGSGSTTFALIRDEATARALRDRFLVRFGAACWTEVARLAA